MNIKLIDILKDNKEYILKILNDYINNNDLLSKIKTDYITSDIIYDYIVSYKPFESMIIDSCRDDIINLELDAPKWLNIVSKYVDLRELNDKEKVLVSYNGIDKNLNLFLSGDFNSHKVNKIYVTIKLCLPDTKEDFSLKYPYKVSNIQFSNYPILINNVDIIKSIKYVNEEISVKKAKELNFNNSFIINKETYEKNKDNFKNYLNSLKNKDVYLKIKENSENLINELNDKIFSKISIENSYQNSIDTVFNYINNFNDFYLKQVNKNTYQFILPINKLKNINFQLNINDYYFDNNSKVILTKDLIAVLSSSDINFSPIINIKFS
jgi:hypothetical protein